MTSFAVLACAFGWMVYALAAFDIGTNPENMPFGPLIAAAIVAACQGRDEFRAFGRTLRRWAGSPWLYALVMIMPIALHVAIVLVNHLLGAPLPTGTQLGTWPEVPIAFLVTIVMVGIGEEAGWTAFAAPILMRRHGALGAWAILASVRILWHLPLMLSGTMSWTVGILGNGGFQLVVIWLLKRSNGQWTLAAVWHATLNAFGGAFFFGMVTGSDLERLNYLLAVVYALAGLAAYLAIRADHADRQTEFPLAPVPSAEVIARR